MATVYDVAQYLLYLDDANEGEGVSNLKLQKLVYYSQGFFGAIFDQKLFNSSISAWTHGPVVSDLYHAFKSNGANPIPFTGFDEDSLLEDEKELIAEVYEVFGQYSAWKLRNMTHEEEPWLNHEETADEIPFEELKNYFKTRLN